jgi:hypothetical protein
MLNWLYCNVLGWLHRRCTHAPSFVTFDIMERSIEEHDSVKWCRICGAVKVGTGSWREPRADWWVLDRAQALRDLSSNAELTGPRVGHRSDE